MKISRVVGRNRDDGNAGKLGVLPNFAGGGKPVQTRQAEIHQNQRRLLLFRQEYRLFTISRLDDPITRHLQELAQHESVVFKVLDHQNKLLLTFHLQPPILNCRWKTIFPKSFLTVHY